MQFDLTEDHRRGRDHLYELVGRAPTDAFVESVSTLCPPLADHVVSHIYGGLHQRPELTGLQREIVTLSVLAALGGCAREIRLHVDIALKSGLSSVEVVEIFLHCSAYAGVPRALNALHAARGVLEEADPPPSNFTPDHQDVERHPHAFGKGSDR
ncbi:carboxymuconolactone decarboxylase family protein [Streptomyces fimicarius]|uniref:carboxymuconolactone decarboxylase family protein n=1 Tax=Streptomyces griseus TaxID=1911 RepID=UPI003687E5E1